MTRPRTIIEFIEPSDHPEKVTCHKAREVRINGIPVLALDDIDLDFSGSDITKVTLTLLPTEVHFRAAAPYEEQEPSKSDEDLTAERDGWRNAARVWRQIAEAAQAKLKEGQE